MDLFKKLYKLIKNFIKIVSKPNFSNLTCFTRKLDLGQMTFLDTSCKTSALHGAFDASRCMVQHLQWEFHRPNITGMSRDL